MASGPPAFVMEASELLRLPPEVIRQAKRDECRDPTSLALLRGLSPCSARLRPRDTLLAIAASQVKQGGWMERSLKSYLESLRALSGVFGVGLPATLAPAALYRQLSIEPRPQVGEASLSRCRAGTDLPGMEALSLRFRGVLLRLRRLRQLESTRKALLRKILTDQFIRSCGVKRTESVLFLLASSPGKQSPSLGEKVLLLQQAQSGLNDSAANEMKFLKWLGSDAEAKGGTERALDSSTPLNLELCKAIPVLAELQDILRQVFSRNSSAELFAENIEKLCEILLETLSELNLPIVQVSEEHSREVSQLLLRELLLPQVRTSQHLGTAYFEQQERCRSALEKVDQTVNNTGMFKVVQR